MPLISNQVSVDSGASKRHKSSEPQWSFKCSRNLPELIDNGIEFDVSLMSNSLMFKYTPELIIRSKIITQLKVEESTQTAALDKLE